MIARLVIQGLALDRGDRRLVEGFGMAVEAGEAVALTGVNGSGKTTLLRAIAGLVRPARGAIRFLDAGGAALDPDTARAGAVQLLGHRDGLEPGRRARDELDFHAAWHGADVPAREAAIERLALSPLLELEVRRLSQGQRRRLALARFLMAPRSLWLLDEPTAPLDARWRATMDQLVAEHLAHGGLVVAAVHDVFAPASRAVPLDAGA